MRRRMLIAMTALAVVVGVAVGTPSASAAETVVDGAGVVRVENGGLHWFTRDDSGGGSAHHDFIYGVSTDVPIWGDWDGNGTKTPGVYRDGTWLLTNAYGGTHQIAFGFGNPGDIPVVGNWDGMGGVGIGVVRGNAWFLRQSPSGGNAELAFNFGNAGDIPVVGNWDANGGDGIGMVRGNTWFLRQSATPGNAELSFVFGNVGDIPMAGNWDGIGGDGIGVVRGNTWFLRQSPSGGNAEASYRYGNVGDLSVHAAYTGLTLAHLRAIYPNTPNNIVDVLGTLNSAMAGAGITTAPRKAAFVANLIVESLLQYNIIEPIDSFCPNYSGGCTYRGRGFIQLTHDYNYRSAGDALGVDLVANPELARSAAYSPPIAIWFWNGHNLNRFADVLDIRSITFAVNGANASQASRTARCNHFKRAMSILTASEPAGIVC